jgi:hypothetical protein
MGKVHPGIDERIRAFLEGQLVYFVATAPLDGAGHINLSPKGLDTFRVLGPNEVAYLDCTGSSAETLAHLRENGRIVLMFCAFEGPPRIFRLQGTGEVVEPPDSGFSELRERFPPELDARSVVRVKVERISDSCGFGVPLFDGGIPRTQLTDWAERKGDEGLRAYQKAKNARSLDGLPALRWVAEEGEGE